ncbi:MAG: TonB-dependent receptor [Woeseiaceae bacterium]|nr:TonB-dependent receptor [Woeseiaceae bacterium]
MRLFAAGTDAEIVIFDKIIDRKPGGSSMQRPSFRRTPLATGVALALGATVMSPAVAQEEVIEEIVAVGIRGSLQSSMVQKRDAQGVSDGIIAEDIGKFPDTNLAESMQRITGVSIDRSAIGEGSKVTVRGVGPDFNLVTLNGRQMPGTTILDNDESGNRSFDFANLASEAVSAINVYKTSQARLPSGGMGATIDIKTARPLDSSDMVFSLGAKAVLDGSVENGDSATPEISGIFSNTSADGRFGVAVSASYQERNLGYNQASHGAGWRTTFAGLNDTWTSLPAEGTNGTTTTNRPTGLYMLPQNVSYTFNDVQRERTNGQLVLQFAPTDTITATLDYTYAENEIMTQDAELSAWNGLGATVISEYSDGPIAVPITYSSNGGADFGGNHTNKGVNHQLDSIGFNLAWDPTDNLSLQLDYHDSESDSGPAGKYGTNNDIGFMSLNRDITDFNTVGDFPVQGVSWTNATAADVAQFQTTGSAFRTALSNNTVEQLRLGGSYFFDNEAYSLDFGVMTTDVDNRSAFSQVQEETWGGSGTPADYDDSLFVLDNVAGYFSGVSGCCDSSVTPEFIRLSSFDDALAAARVAVPDDRRWNTPTGPSDPNADKVVDKLTNEETTAAYVQFSASFDIGDKPANLSAGLRWEETDVTSSALVPVVTAMTWNSNNEFGLVNSGQDYTTLTGKYDYVLPSIDFNVELTEDVILRLGYSETIGRPNWNQIQGGQVLNEARRGADSRGSEGNPALLPLESTNIDLSVEWYYGSGSYLSVAYFDKSIDNFVSETIVLGTPFNLPHPTEGPRFAEADAATGGTGDLTLIRQYIFDNYGNTPEVTATGVDASGNTTGTIAGVVGEDPAAVFRITTQTNADESGVDGWELAVQHFFGDSGFGVSANYTMVDGDEKYDNTLTCPAGGILDFCSQGDPIQQFAIEGISDSANLIGFFENDKWSTRIAYNWRDEYLTNRNFAGQVNPEYVESYGQWDGNVSYNVNDQLTIILEGINITDEYTRSYVRTPGATGFVTTLGARYMIGARYDFR